MIIWKKGFFLFENWSFSGGGFCPEGGQLRLGTYPGRTEEEGLLGHPDGRPRGKLVT